MSKGIDKYIQELGDNDYRNLCESDKLDDKIQLRNELLNYVNNELSQLPIDKRIPYLRSKHVVPWPKVHVVIPRNISKKYRDFLRYVLISTVGIFLALIIYYLNHEDPSTIYSCISLGAIAITIVVTLICDREKVIHSSDIIWSENKLKLIDSNLLIDTDLELLKYIKSHL